MKGDRESVLATGSFDASAGIWKGDNSRHTAQEHDADDDDEGKDGDGDEDYRFAVILEGHDSEIKSVAWSAHGTFLATCSRDKSVWIWEALEESGGGGGFGGPADDDDDNFETVAVLQEHEGDVKCVAWHPSEESCLASSSYDDLVRVWREDADAEWGCVAVCEGHKGTVWCVDWEPEGNADGLKNGAEVVQEDENGRPQLSGPRLVSCSDDLSIRVWRREPKARPQRSDGPRIPSIIRSTADEETWYEEAQLPQRHSRAIYAVGWSKRSRRVVSAGSDGMIVVYEERPKANADVDMSMDTNDASQHRQSTDWVAIAEIEGAHGVFEINHVCWAKRYDKGRKGDDEEVIVSTGDDGEVKMWSILSDV